MRVVFIGASQFGLNCLRALDNLTDGLIEIVGVITAPQKFSISYRPQGVVNVLHADIASHCHAQNIPYQVLTTNMNDEVLFNTASAWQPDMFLVVGWYHLLPKKWLALAPAYGLHASLLPNYSGGAPLVWAMINGERETGISFFKFDSGVDNGPIVGQLHTEINEYDTIATLYERIEQSGIELITTHLPKLANGSASLILQDESKRRIYPQRAPEDGLINWTLSSQKIYDFIRAQTRPYPGAFTNINQNKISIWKSKPVKNDLTLKPGEITLLNANEIRVGCGENTALDIVEISLNDVEMSTLELIDSLQLTNGSTFHV